MSLLIAAKITGVLGERGVLPLRFQNDFIAFVTMPIMYKTYPFSIK